MADEADYAKALAKILSDRLETEAKKRLPNAFDPMHGLDAAPVPLTPIQERTPYTPSFSGNRFNLSLPANRGAMFDAYVDYKLNPLKPQDAGINGAGLRYRWDF